MNITLLLKAVGQCALAAVHGAHSAPILEHALQVAHVMPGPEHGTLHLLMSAISLCGLVHHLVLDEQQAPNEQDETSGLSRKGEADKRAEPALVVTPQTVVEDCADHESKGEG